jgi:hypothetical protein
LSRNRIQARVKRDLPLTFSDREQISAHGGLELFRRYLVAIDLPARLRRAVGDGGDYGAVRLVLLVIALLLAGGRRLAHLAVLARDPVILRFAGMQRLPADRTVARWMAGAAQTVIESVATVVRDVAHDAIASLALPRLTLDLDGTVLRVCGAGEGAERGFNPHHPKDRSYYPLTAHLGQTGHLLRVPLWKWLGIREQIATRSRWMKANASVSGFEIRLPIPQWNRVQRVVVYRKRVFHETHRNFQLDLFSPDDGHYEYSAVATNLRLGVPALWDFMAGRGGHEKTFGELKQHLAFDAIPGRDRQANALWQQLSVLSHNLVRSFQLCVGAPARPRSRKRTFLFVFRSLQTLRFTLFDQPARIVRPGGRSELRFAVSPVTRLALEQAELAIQRAA